MFVTSSHLGKPFLCHNVLALHRACTCKIPYDGASCGHFQIHALLEADFVPLELCARLVPLLDALEGLNRPLSPASPVPNAALGQYKRALQQVP